MKIGLLLGLLLLSGWGGLTRIHDRNTAIQQAQAAYRRGDFSAAVLSYKEAVNKLGATDEEVILNLGHASVRAGQAAEARAAYGRLLTSPTLRTRSIAQQQLAVLASSKGDYAQALSFLRQALLSNPANSEARYNYEVISDYLARRRQNPTLPPPSTGGGQDKQKQEKGPSEQAQQPKPQAGQDKPGELDDAKAPNDPQSSPQARPNSNGQRDPNQPADVAGNESNGGFQPGRGPGRNMAQGSQPGSVRGLGNDDGGPDAAGASRRAGTEAAALDEDQLQTQRARLQQMNLSSGQARQVLEALNAAEQQYLQQLPRPTTRKPASGKPAW